MTIPENIVIFIGITLIVSLLVNAGLVGLVVAYINTERNRLYYERKMKRKNEGKRKSEDD